MDIYNLYIKEIIFPFEEFIIKVKDDIIYCFSIETYDPLAREKDYFERLIWKEELEISTWAEIEYVVLNNITPTPK